MRFALLSRLELSAVARGIGAVLLLGLGLAGLPGCSQGEAKAPIALRPLDERRAIDVIRKAVRSAGLEPGPSKMVPIPGNGKQFRIDVTVVGHEYGVAYITSSDLTELAEWLRPPNKRDEKLRIERVGADGEIRVVDLYEANYTSDDHAGDAHAHTTIAAENELGADAANFLEYAKRQGYP